MRSLDRFAIRRNQRCGRLRTLCPIARSVTAEFARPLESEEAPCESLWRAGNWRRTSRGRSNCRVGPTHDLQHGERPSTDRGAVPIEDLVGGFEIRGGNLVPGGYQRNPNHVILSEDGFFQLPEELEQALLEELKALEHRPPD